MKLVRDLIPEIIHQEGLLAKFHIADEEEYYSRLMEKLQEEVNEFLLDENVEELADIMEVIMAICEHKNIKFSEVFRKQRSKKSAKGGFKNRIILEEICKT